MMLGGGVVAVQHIQTIPVHPVKKISEAQIGDAAASPRCGMLTLVDGIYEDSECDVVITFTLIPDGKQRSDRRELTIAWRVDAKAPHGQN